jgi:4'-phosphopantetheinyl transferase EntD
VAVQEAVERRRNEFATGRACIRQALDSLGCEYRSVPAESNRAPCWPRGVIGSVSHSRTLAVAVVARRETALAVGIDVETVAPLEPNLWPLITRPDEAMPLGERATLEGLRFSCKEAAFKCWFQAGGDRIIEFLDVWLGLGSGVFTANMPPPGPRVIQGRWAKSLGHWWSSAWVF